VRARGQTGGAEVKINRDTVELMKVSSRQQEELSEVFIKGRYGG
jgi:hypothetical protein